MRLVILSCVLACFVFSAQAQNVFNGKATLALSAKGTSTETTLNTAQTWCELSEVANTWRLWFKTATFFMQASPVQTAIGTEVFQFQTNKMMEIKLQTAGFDIHPVEGQTKTATLPAEITFANKVWKGDAVVNVNGVSFDWTLTFPLSAFALPLGAHASEFGNSVTLKVSNGVLSLSK